MATSITQARPLLTADELALFEQSRAEPIKSLTLARLLGKVTKARTLRDKYRDLFRRQTVAVRSGPGTKGRSPVGADNERTQRKAEILQEVLGRYEARVELLEAKQARESAVSAKASAGRAKGAEVAPATHNKPVASGLTKKRAASAASPTGKSSAPAGDASLKRSVGRKGANATTADVANTTSSVKSSAAGKTRIAAATSDVAGGGSGGSGSGSADSHTSQVGGDHGQVSASGLNRHANRSAKAPSDKAPTAHRSVDGQLSHAPTDLVPAALRSNPLKDAPSNIAIHAHQGASARRSQGKRDSR